MALTSNNVRTKITGKIYLRLSKDEPGQTSTADQERECRRLAERLGIQEIEVYCEQPGTSGYKDVERPVFDELIASLSTGDVVLAWALDRLTRKGMEQAGTILRRLEESGARLVTVSDGVDTGTDNADINVGIRAIMAREYSKSLSKNVKRGKETGAVAGNWGGGNRWYGYSPDPDGRWRGPKKIDDTEAKVWHELRQRWLDGESFYAIAPDFNGRGLPTVAGKQWKADNMPRLLFNPRYAGIRMYQGTEYRGNWPALCTAEQWAELQIARQRTGQVKHVMLTKPGARSYLLTGLLICSKCGEQLRGGARKHRGKQIRRYRCHGCHNSYRVADPIEHFVVEAVMFRLDSPELGKLLISNQNQAEVTALVAKQEALTLRLNQLDDYFFNPGPGEPPLERAAYSRQKTAILAANEAASTRLTAILNQQTGLTLQAGQRLRTAFTAWPLAKQHRLIRLTISSILVKPTDAGNLAKHEYYEGRWKFKPADIEINWIDGGAL